MNTLSLSYIIHESSHGPDIIRKSFLIDYIVNNEIYNNNTNRLQYYFEEEQPS